MKNIGLFGGTFDPVHNGHLIISEYLREELFLEEIWFIPSKIHPLKKNEHISASRHRLEMLRLATADNQYFKICEIELIRESTSYTVETIEELSIRYAYMCPQFYFLMGMDNVNDLHRWKNPDKISRMSQIIAFGRPGFQPCEEAKPLLDKIQFVHVPLLEISSTFVRSRRNKGTSIKYFVPSSVESYIHEKQLYK